MVSTLRLKFTKTPLFTSLLVVLFSIWGGAIITIAGLNWTFMAVTIMFLGGIIIVFIYTSRINFRKKNIITFPLKKLTASLRGITILRYLFRTLNFLKHDLAPFSLYTSSNSINLIFVAVYLLFILLTLIKIVRCGEGPLKTIFI